MSVPEETRTILSILVDNEPGVLSRIAGLFSSRNFNIESLCVAETTDPLASRITLVTRGDQSILEQIKKQLNKLINVIKVSDFTGQPHVEREGQAREPGRDPPHGGHLSVADCRCEPGLLHRGGYG